MSTGIGSSRGARTGGATRLRIAAVAIVVVAAASLGAAAAGATIRAPKIYGGQTDTRSDVGWVTAIQHHPRVDQRDGFQRQFCGGSLIA